MCNPPSSRVVCISKVRVINVLLYTHGTESLIQTVRAATAILRLLTLSLLVLLSRLHLFLFLLLQRCIRLEQRKTTLNADDFPSLVILTLELPCHPPAYAKSLAKQFDAEATEDVLRALLNVTPVRLLTSLIAS